MIVAIIILGIVNLIAIVVIGMRLTDEITKNRQELLQQLTLFSTQITQQITSLTGINEQKLEGVRRAVESNLKSIQEDNSKQLEKMRLTVDEKLHATLEKRLGESFALVSQRLEQVHKGLGEMQHLANGVGDLKRVLSNVKTRGSWGEAQLGNLLEQILSPEQYVRNCITKEGSRDPVEYAIKLPDALMPIDAKFPIEDYERLLLATDAADLPAIETAGKALESRIKLEAKTIKDKYISPPATTDFAILFLPIEGLYAEFLRRPGLAEQLRRDFNVIIAGPTTIVAILNSLQMGFRTLAVQKRAGEVWGLLGVVKNEFGKFGDILEKTKEKLVQATNTLDDASRKSRTIETKLRKVQEIAAPSDVQSIEGTVAGDDHA